MGEGKKPRPAKRTLIFSYLAIWAAAIIDFWFFTADDGAMGYAILFLWIILPITTFVISFLISKNDYWGKWKWLSPIVFGVMYMLAEYATFSMANNVEFNKVNVPDLGMILIGAVFSLVGLVIGYLSCETK